MEASHVESGQLVAGRFQLAERLGRGGLGEVWRAFDEESGDVVACKILRGDLAHDRTAVAFLQREVIVSRRLRHSAIVEVFRFWDDDVHPFITMRYVPGTNLAKLLVNRGEAYPLQDVVQWFGTACEALDFAHGRGVLHRDIKPENFMLHRDDDSVHLLDFGLAAGEWDEEGHDDGDEIRGTLAYMSPEVLRGEPPTPKSDQYGLAVTAYELLSGAPPFRTGEVMAQIQVKMAPPIDALSESMNRVLLRALSKTPDRRYSTCRDFYTALRAASEGKYLGSSAAEVGDLNDPSRETAVQGGFEIATRRTRLGKMLVESKAVGQGDLAEGLLRQQETGEKLGEALVGLGLLSEESLSETLSHQLQIPLVRGEELKPDYELTEQAGKDRLLEYHALPLRRSPYAIVVAMADPLDMEALNHLEESFAEPIDPVVATYADVEAALALLGDD